MSNEKHVFERKQLYYGKRFHDGKTEIYKVATIARKSGPFITFRKMLNNCEASKEKYRDIIFHDKYGNELVKLAMAEINARDKVEA